MEIISFANLSLMLLPVAVVLLILHRWQLKPASALYANVRMLIQLFLVGYVLTFIFEAESSLIVIGTLCIMLCAASWISLRPLSKRNPRLLTIAFLSISLSGVSLLLLVTQCVLRADPWYSPHTVIPLAGMIFSSSMNSVSLAAERFTAEKRNGKSLIDARNQAFQAALIPVTNSLLAVGLVSLPGMMTGQILSGVDPTIAARYQIVVMTMIFSCVGLSAALFLKVSASELEQAT